MHMFKRALTIATAALIAMSTTASVQSQDLSFDAYVQLMIAKARAQGVSETTLRRMTEGLTPNQRVIRLDRGQPGTPTRTGYPDMAPYIATHVNPTRGDSTKQKLTGWQYTITSSGLRQRTAYETKHTLTSIDYM